MAVGVADLEHLRTVLPDRCSGLVAGEWRAVSETIKNLRLRDFQTIRDQSDAICRRRPIPCPSVDGQMVMVAAGGKEQRTRIRPLRHREAEKFVVEPLRGGKVGYLQVDMAEVSLRRNMRWHWRIAFDQAEQFIEVQSLGCHDHVPL